MGNKIQSIKEKIAVNPIIENITHGYIYIGSVIGGIAIAENVIKDSLPEVVKLGLTLGGGFVGGRIGQAALRWIEPETDRRDVASAQVELGLIQQLESVEQ